MSLCLSMYPLSTKNNRDMEMMINNIPQNVLKHDLQALCCFVDCCCFWKGSSVSWVDIVVGFDDILL